MSARHPVATPGQRGPQPPTPTPNAGAAVAHAATAHAAAAGADGPDDAAEAEPLLYTVEEAAALLRVRPSWLQRKAAARAVPCTFLGKHLRFSRTDLDAVIASGAQHPRSPRQRSATAPAGRRPVRRPG